MTTSLQLAELLCARLCHDLSGPLGSLLGVLEIARDEQAESETLAIADETATELVTRLKLMRTAWGLPGEPLDVAHLRTFADSLSATRRLRFDLSGLEPSSVFQADAARLIANVLLLAAESLPGDGVAAFAGSPDANVLVTLSGPKAAWPQGFAACLTDESYAWAALTDARRIQAPITALIARAQGARLSLLMATGPTGDAGAALPLLITFGGQVRAGS